MEIEYPVNCPLMESAISMDECFDIHMGGGSGVHGAGKGNQSSTLQADLPKLPISPG